MDPHTFFIDHTYYKWDKLLDDQTCNAMAAQARNAYNNGNYYDEKPAIYDSLIQKNTKHIEKQGYTRKYKAIYGDDVKTLTPLIYEYYTNENVIKMLSDVAGCHLHPVPTHKTVDLAVQIYSEPGDGTNWHHDRSIFNGGRAFTFLTVIYNTSDQQLTVWTDKYGTEKIQWSVGKAVLIEKFKTYHSVTPLGKGERMLLTLTYSEKPYSPSMLRPIEYFLNKSKNYGYLGFDAFTWLDYVVFVLTVLVIVYCIWILLRKRKQNKKFSRQKKSSK